MLEQMKQWKFPTSQRVGISYSLSMHTIEENLQFVIWEGHSKPAPTSAPWRMNGKCSENSFLLGFISLANHGG